MPTRVTPQELLLVHCTTTLKGSEFEDVSERKKAVEAELRKPGCSIADLRYQLGLINQEYEEKRLVLLEDILLYLRHMEYVALGIPSHCSHERIPIHPSQWNDLLIDFDYGTAEGGEVSYSSLMFFISLEEAERASFLALADGAQKAEAPILANTRMTLRKVHRGPYRAYFEVEARGMPQPEPNFDPDAAEAARAMWEGTLHGLREEDRETGKITSGVKNAPQLQANATAPTEPGHNNSPKRQDKNATRHRNEDWAHRWKELETTSEFADQDAIAKQIAHETRWTGDRETITRAVRSIRRGK